MYVLLGVFIISAVSVPQAYAMIEEEPLNIQEVETNLGVTAWLVESHNLPMVSVEVAFKAGAGYDPSGKRGVAGILSGLLSEGAGNLKSQSFQEEVERLGMRMRTGTGLLGINISMDALPEVLDEAFGLFSLAIKNPRLEEKDFMRLKDAALAVRERVEENPRQLAQEAFASMVYGRHHPYASPVTGTSATLKEIHLKDIRRQHKKTFTRQNMVISVVGAIKPQQLKTLLETHFKDLPKGKVLKALPAPKEQPAAVYKKVKDIPQTTIIMGHKGVNRQDEDYFAALFANHILGGGGFASLLMEEVREKRGLVYGIHSAFAPLPFWGSFRIVAQTKNKTAQEVVNIVRAEIQKLQREGVPTERYENALSYLVGSFPLRLDSNADILGYLTFMQTEGLGKDYMNMWIDRIRSVTPAAVHKVFKERLMPENMAIVMVGNPDNLTFEEERAAKAIAAAQNKVAKTTVQAHKLEPSSREKTPIQAPVQNEVEMITEEAIAAPIAAVKPIETLKHTQKRGKPKPPNDYRELKDTPIKPRTRRNVNAKKWL